MPLSNFFKKNQNKPHKKASPRTLSKDDVMGSPALQRNRVNAATEVMGLFENYFQPTKSKVHPETVLSSIAWLAGSSLQRSFGIVKGSKPGTIVLSERANKEWPKLLKLFMFYVRQGGMDLKTSQLITKFSDAHQPQQTILEIQEKLQDGYHAIMKKYELDYVDGARAGVIASSMLFNYYCVNKKEIDPRLGAGLIARGFVQGVKTTPLPLNASKMNQNTHDAVQAKPKNVSRYVIGEIGAVIEDAKKNGGEYTLLNPMIEAKLRESNIDPIVVHVQGLVSQLEGKVGRVDFVQMNIDQILQQKKHDRMPVHISLAHYLHEKSGEYGYQREGNSWVLKE